MPDSLDDTRTRSGYVTLLGRPNAGKSTLLNRFVGQRLSIVTPKAQTTWQRVTGILTTSQAQLVFLDTPGLLQARDLLQHAMRAAALAALQDADVVVLVVDASRFPEPSDKKLLAETLEGTRIPVIVALNKVDIAAPNPLRSWERWLTRRPWGARLHRVSAERGEGTDALLGAVLADLPEGPFLYPPDEVAANPVRFFAAELVREAIFEQYGQEIPYATFCQIEEFVESRDPVYIKVRIWVEKPSQKGILIGAGGRAIRELGQVARAKIEHFLGRPVYLDLWVKPLRAWRKDRARLLEMGFRVPEEDIRHRP